MHHGPRAFTRPLSAGDFRAFPESYLTFLEHFNQGRFFEAHEALEELWLETRHDADGSFHKGLIQVAAAFVHWDDARPGPATALLQTARRHLEQYPPQHHGLDLADLRRRMTEWESTLQRNLSGGRCPPRPVARLELRDPPP